MKKAWLLMTMAFLTFEPVAQAGSLKDLDADMGFRGVLLGSKREETPGLKPVPDADGNYIRTPEILKLGKARLSRIVYSFHDDVLISISLETNEPEKLIATLESMYGRAGKSSNGYMNWTGKTVVLACYMREGQDAIATFQLKPKNTGTNSTTSGTNSCGPGRHWVSGYTTKRGKFVSGHCANNPSH